VTHEGQPGSGRGRSTTSATLRCPTCGEHRPSAALLTLEDVALRLGTSLRHVRRLADERRIPIVKVGRYVRFDGHEIEHWIDDHRIAEVDPAALARAARRRRTALGRSSTVGDHHGTRQRTA
jgi:excisionase family DNA binding protein